MIHKAITFISKNTPKARSHRVLHGTEPKVIKSKSWVLPLASISLPQSQILLPIFKIHFQKSLMRLQATTQLWKHRIDMVLNDALFAVQNILETVPHKCDEDLTFSGSMMWWWMLWQSANYSLPAIWINITTVLHSATRSKTLYFHPEIFAHVWVLCESKCLREESQAKFISIQASHGHC